MRPLQQRLSKRQSVKSSHYESVVQNMIHSSEASFSKNEA